MFDLDFDLSDNDLRKILKNSQVIAMVGASDDHYYSSYQVLQDLLHVGYTVYPVNPNIDDEDGVKSYPSLAEVPEPIDIVDVFRNPIYLPEVVSQAIAAKAKTLWCQFDVASPDQAPEQKAISAGLRVLSNLRNRTEHERLKSPPKPAADGD